MAMAVLSASRATCVRGQVGCVLVRDRRVLATGYNGPVGGNPDCLGVDRCRRTADGGCAETAHAEQNAVAYAARFGVDLTGATCYLSGYSPCLMCAKLLIQTGVRRVVFACLYRDTMPLDFLADAGVAIALYIGPAPMIGWQPRLGAEAAAAEADAALATVLANAPAAHWHLQADTEDTRCLLRDGGPTAATSLQPDRQ